jgi:predicted lipoprotein with Yx(FWY)xxD motif
LPRVRLLALIICLVLGAISVSVAAAANHGRPAKLLLHKTALGKILVNRPGYTVYAFTKDTRNHDACQNVTSCTVVWPPVTSHGAPVAGPGVKAALLGTIKLKNGTRQVTYAGHPLYTYIADKSPGQTSYVNIDQFGGRWPALNAAGHEVK